VDNWLKNNECTHDYIFRHPAHLFVFMGGIHTVIQNPEFSEGKFWVLYFLSSTHPPNFLITKT
jgi:hypothetical protein